MVTEFIAALNQVANERGIPVDDVLQAIESSLVAAFKKDYLPKTSEISEITAKINRETGEAHIFKDGVDVTPAGFGRIAAQTASQVLMQKIRKTEIESVVDEYRAKVGTLFSAYIFRVESNGVIVFDLGRVQGIMPPREQIPGEFYRNGQRLNVIIKEVQDTPKGPEVIVSRADKGFIKVLFTEEVPEIKSGVVKIESIARDAGSRTKIAVSSKDKNVDPVGSCVGHKGVRVQSILSEINPEKVDIISYNADPKIYIAQALSPARVTSVTIDKETKKAQVKVPEDQQSLAIGKGGQNVRLAHLLTNWSIDIEGIGNVLEAASKITFEEDTKKPMEDRRKKRATNLQVLGFDKLIERSLKKAGVASVEKLKELSRKDLLEIEGIGSKSAEKILKILSVH